MRPALVLVLVAALATPLVPAAPGEAAPDRPRAGKVRLKAFGSCTGLVRYARRNALRRARALVVPGGRGSPTEGGGGDDSGGRAEGAPTPGAGGGQVVDHSGTNVQEEGVDEPDIVKTDGRRLFVVAGGALHAIDPRAATPVRLGSLALGPGGRRHELLLHGDRLLVISAVGGFGVIGPAIPAQEPEIAMPVDGRPRTQLTEVDVSDPRDMRVLRTLRVDGDYLTGRLTGRTARVVIASFPQALEAGVRRIRRAGLPAWMPRAELTVPGRGRTIRRAVRCRAVRRTASFSGLDMVTVLTIDLERGLPAIDADALLTGAETVYASPAGLYVATRRWISPRRIGSGEPPEDLRTAIHRFDTADADRTTYRSSGEVPGFLLSQWALSEHDGHLRVASTDAPQWWSGGERESESHVTVLRERGDRLARIGSVGGLGRGEQIYAVRFIGDVGYVVTFRQVDPLYTVGLGDPVNPRVLGELKIRGYSAYLHPVGDGLLLGVGVDATEQGRRLGTQLSLFDVSKPREPKRLHHHTIGSGTASQVEYDHRAFLYWQRTGLAVVPLEEWFARRDPFAGAAGFRVTAAGIAPLGRVEHPAPSFLGRIERSAVIGDRVLTVSEAGVLATPLGSFAGGSWLGFPATIP